MEVDVTQPQSNGYSRGPEIDEETVIRYFERLLQDNLGATIDEAHDSMRSKVYHDNVSTQAMRFASDNQAVLFILKDQVDNRYRTGHPHQYTLSTQLHLSPSTVSSLALIKRPGALSPHIPLSSQVQVLNLPGFVQADENSVENGTAAVPFYSPYEALHSIVHLALNPYFDAYTKGQDGSSKLLRSKANIEAKSGIPATKKRFAELELSLLHLQQNIDIPRVSLSLHPIIQHALDEANRRKLKISVEDAARENLIPAEVMTDGTFLTALTANVGSWIRSIQAVTRLSRDMEGSTAAQEINFWISMENALDEIESHLAAPGILLTMGILQRARRFQATTSFHADTGLKDAKDLVQKYNLLMRDFPLDDLLSATSLKRIKESLEAIFSHMSRKLKLALAVYPIKRAVALVGAISGDLDTQVHTLVNGRSLMRMKYEDFGKIIESIDEIWDIWDEGIRDFTVIGREMSRRRNQQWIPVRLRQRHSKTQERLAYISTFRLNHEQLQWTIYKVLGTSQSTNVKNGAPSFQLPEPIANGVGIGRTNGMPETDATEEISQAYTELGNVDVLDITDEGTAIWVQAEMTYNERAARVENSIIAQLRDRLATARSAGEMFRVFSKFNALFVRPKIRGAIAEYQTQLIDGVKKDIELLHERFKKQYGHSEAHAMAQLRDLPPISGAIIWARQIERQLDQYMKKVEDVLGEDWKLHVEGQKLASESEMFKQKLNTKLIFEAWMNDVSHRRLNMRGRLFTIVRDRAAGNQLELRVNFDSQVISFFKEVRNLLWLQQPVPHSLQTVAKEAKRVYPYTVSMMESIRTFLQITRKMAKLVKVVALLNGYLNDVQQLLRRGTTLRWETFVHSYEMPVRSGAITSAGLREGMVRTESAHVLFVRDVATSVSTLQVKTDSLIMIHENMQTAIRELSTCAYHPDALKKRIETVQGIIDQLNLQNYANLRYWVAETNRSIAEILLLRLQDAIDLWITTFKEAKAPPRGQLRGRNKSYKTPGLSGMDGPEFVPSVHEIVMRNQVIYLEPPTEDARANWFHSVQSWIGTICHQEQIRASRYEMSIGSTQARGFEQETFAYLLSQCPDRLAAIYTAIEERLDEVNVYMSQWYQFQSLWDLQADAVYDMLGENLAEWLQLLQEIRKSRETFDTSETIHAFGNFVLDYEQVQSKINAKYDQWQQDIIMAFASLLGDKQRDVHGEIQASLRDLEGQSLETSSTAQAVAFITSVQQCKRRVEVWEPLVGHLQQGQGVLQRNRFTPPPGWTTFEQLDLQWNALQELLTRKDGIVSGQADALRAKISAEDQLIHSKILEAVAEWNEKKPVGGHILPEAALTSLRSSHSHVSKLNEDYDMVTKAKEALEMSPAAASPLPGVLEEIQDFQSVWSALATIWQGIDEIRGTAWSSAQPRKIRSALDNLVKMTKEMPSRMRQYAAFEHVQSTLRLLLKANPMLGELRGEALRDRHWSKIYKALKPNQRYAANNQTVGDVWDLKLTVSEKVIREIIAQAQGEMALEEFLRQVRETWQNYTLDLVNYQNKCRLIRGFNDIFTKCGEHLNSLQAMHHSPYYKEFEEDASSWEDKLNRLHVLFDVWTDVQRQWVYLEGVFTGNADIKHLLPQESARFQNINNEFFAVMKKVYRSTYILDVLAIEGVQKSLDRLGELLAKIQKALGEYLERERTSFPRFYFVGDEDLLEIIGNSGDTVRISKHFKKMFAGIAELTVDESSQITGFASKEGETIALHQPISLIKIPRINDWLTTLELAMRQTLAQVLEEAVEQFSKVVAQDTIPITSLRDYLDSFPVQIAVLATQVVWTSSVQRSLENAESLEPLLERQRLLLRLLAGLVLGDLELIQRRKCEHLITEFVHQRDVILNLISHKVTSPESHLWLLQMRFVWNPAQEPLHRLVVHMANAQLEYGFEYLGVPDRLVRTPLTDRCFLTLTQALCQRQGGSPYGPAGTGKTESVKALGLQLGRFTLVFCCDDTFDFQAMGRIFLGICQVGAWGCFDEFNRLEERILSAVSQQIQNIQLGCRASTPEKGAQIELINRSLTVNPNTGIFITMNPGYAGRSNLPDNLKKLFRSVAMSKPDKELIAEVMLYSQGFEHAKELAGQVVPFFDRCDEQFTSQPHYDFGLRALKSVLVSSGGLKRHLLRASALGEGSQITQEAGIMLQSIRETIAPKLVRQDVEILSSIEANCFPKIEYAERDLGQLRSAITQIAKQNNLQASDTWLLKTIQLYQIQSIHHGFMIVGQSGIGKSSSWRTLLQAMQEVEGVEGVSHVIDPKVMSKETLYGVLDPTTREWTDGLFTGILRKVVDNLRGEDKKRHWIVFDGDVDPDWVENLNSVLDDNKLLTLPNGERLSLPPNVRIVFEVQSLQYATLATVSRCGMVWFNDDTVTPRMMVQHYLDTVRTTPIKNLEDESVPVDQMNCIALDVQARIADVLTEQLLSGDLCDQCLERAAPAQHIMEFTYARALTTAFSLMNKVCRSVVEYNLQHPDFPLEQCQIEQYVCKKLLLIMVWSLTGDCPLTERKHFGDFVASLTSTDVPALTSTSSLIDFDVTLPDAQWVPWQSQVPSIEIGVHSITQTDVVIPTLDTVRHEDVLYSWLAEHRPLLLCGPPGSGKTMTLFSALRKLPHMEVVGLNFSSATTPDLLIKTLEQYCEYRKTLSGVLMSPLQIGRWLVVFCDEINLPASDKYGTQRVISFLRQLIEQNGFWRSSDKIWVTLDRIQFVGACNPPTDAGRSPLGTRFLRHAPLIMVDYPGETSLHQIYSTFNNAMLKVIPNIRGYAEPLTQAMIRLYLASQQRFTTAIQPHYIYSPRELTRWTRGILEAIRPLDTITVEGLVRIWAHEALRLFQDRLVNEDERVWTEQTTRKIALDLFPGINEEQALGGPILYSNWLSKNYVPVQRETLREFVKARLRTFCEEEVDVPLILFNDVLEHVLRIDRVFRQPQGHLILIGVSGSGKTTLSRFVAWMNGLKVFQIRVHGRYTASDFDDDLKEVLRRCGTRGEKICFIMDESNVLDSGFLERMNTLLANAEIPGLFEGDEYAALMTACREGAQRQGLLLDSQEELYRWFTQQVVKNLHVVFTMNPPEEGLSSKAATSPALFNRCVLNWFGNWSDQALFQVGTELTQGIDLDLLDYSAPNDMPLAYAELTLPLSYRDSVINSFVYVHHSLQLYMNKLQHQAAIKTFLTPRHFLDFVAQYVKLFLEKREELEDQQRHLNVGLDKLKDTVDKVRDLRASLALKKSELERKQAEANEKLDRMLDDQKEAEKRKTISLQIQVSLKTQEREVASRKEVVLTDLARAEPAVLEAQRSVSNIKRQHLTEVRSMGSPPAGVKLALESVCTLLGHRVDNWKTIQAIVRRDDFIASIVNYDNEHQMTPSLRAKMENEYLSLEEFSFERVNRASKACGPLVQWVEAQVNYSTILNRVGPLRDEVARLEDQALQTRAEAEATQNNIRRLEDSLARYTAEYATLISQIEAIKTEMARVQSKVDRSVKLLESLSSEKVRWEQSSSSFETQTSTLVGDVLVAAAFLAYSGLFDQQYRRSMLEDWLHQLSLSNIKYKALNPMTEYLSTADDRLQWQDHSLPVDDLCTENAIILKRYNRYPLIIDPSGRVTDFLKGECKERRLTVTSFLDDSFTKQLESCLRFGNPILIQDAEHLDPILNHVLNKEYQRTGGRVLIQLGKQEIDFSPAFKLYLSTRDPLASFPPDICSRTTFVNFTVTQSSLQSQSLNDVLKVERPDVDERRSNLLKLQGEFKIHLRQLEKRLLQALNESKGNILDDDVVIESLEKLKQEAGEISHKMSETEGVMTEVDEITQQYGVIASSCSAIFSILENLHHLNLFYQFSLQYFLDIFQIVLKSRDKRASESNTQARVDHIVRSLFVVTYQKTSLGLLQKDRITFALLLAQASPYPMDHSLLDLLLDESVEAVDVSASPNHRKSALAAASGITALSPYISVLDEATLDEFLKVERAEEHVPKLWAANTSPVDIHLRSLLILKLFRTDRLVPSAELFCKTLFGSSFYSPDAPLSKTVHDVSALTPVALCSSPGFDASYKVDSLVASIIGQRCTNIAMGSNESTAMADKALSTATSNGGWVLIKNVHLAPGWLQNLEKRLEAMRPHPDFRLFLSMETGGPAGRIKIPVNLLRASRVLMYEQPAGIKANMRDTLSTGLAKLPSSTANTGRAVATQPRYTKPLEKARLYLLLSFLHAVIQERLRYISHAPPSTASSTANHPISWKQAWEFNDSDYASCAFIVDAWLATAAGARENVDPRRIPWELLRALVTDMYGGKVDDGHDYEVLRGLVGAVLQPAAFESGWRVVDAVRDASARERVGAVAEVQVQGRKQELGPEAPLGPAVDEMWDWVERLPEREPPSWLGLPEDAERILLVAASRGVMADLRRILRVLDEREVGGLA